MDYVAVPCVEQRLLQRILRSFEFMLVSTSTSVSWNLFSSFFLNKNSDKILVHSDKNLETGNIEQIFLEKFLFVLKWTKRVRNPSEREFF